VSDLLTRRARLGALLGLAVIVGIAADLRLRGIMFGLPAVYNPDEVAIMSRALAFAKGDLNPHNFLYPTFYFYVLFAWVGVSFVVSWIAGLVPSLAAFQTQFFTDPTNIYLAGRLLGVACGVATVVLTYVLGARLGGRAAGLAAALFLATSPTHVRDSHYVKHDVPVTLAIVVAQIAILRLLDDTRDPAKARRDVLLAGAACGLAFSTHYYAVFLMLPLMLAVYWRERSLARIVLAGVAATVVFFALSPFLLVEPLTAWRDVVANRQIVIDRAVESQHGLFANARAYLRMLQTEAVGWPVLLAAVVGAGLCLAVARPPSFYRRRDDQRRLATVLLAFALPFFLFICNTVAAGRYLNPIIPTLTVFAGFAVAWIAGLLSDTRYAAWTAVSLAVVLAWEPYVVSGGYGDFFRQTDTRTLAQQIIERDIPAGSTVLVQPYSVQLTQSRESLVEALEAHLGDAGRASTKFALRLALNPYPAPAYRTLFLGSGGLDVDKIYLGYRELSDPDGLEVLRRAKVQYVVLKRYNTEDPEVVPLREQLRHQGRLLASVSPYAAEADQAARARVAPFLHNTDTPFDPALERPGPGIEVWQVP
jgi:hypothetical protein